MELNGLIKNESIKIVFVGDTFVGKSCLIKTFLDIRIEEDYEPTVINVYKKTHNFIERQIDLEIRDTSGDEQPGVNR